MIILKMLNFINEKSPLEFALILKGTNTVTVTHQHDKNESPPFMMKFKCPSQASGTTHPHSAHFPCTLPSQLFCSLDCKLLSSMVLFLQKILLIYHQIYTSVGL